MHLFLLLLDFDKFMEEHKSELKEKSLEESMDMDMYDHQLAEIERADHQVEKQSVTFWNHFLMIQSCQRSS